MQRQVAFFCARLARHESVRVSFESVHASRGRSLKLEGGGGAWVRRARRLGESLPLTFSFTTQKNKEMAAPPAALFYKLLDVEADGLTRGRSLEAECDRLVALPAALVGKAAATTPASPAPLSVAALHSAVASVVPGSHSNPYLEEAELHTDSQERLHYLGRALEVRERESGRWRRWRRERKEGGGAFA